MLTATNESSQLIVGEPLCAGDFLGVDERTGKVQRLRSALGSVGLIGIAKRDYGAGELIRFPEDLLRRWTGRIPERSIEHGTVGAILRN